MDQVPCVPRQSSVTDYNSYFKPQTFRSLAGSAINFDISKVECNYK